MKIAPIVVSVCILNFALPLGGASRAMPAAPQQAASDDVNEPFELNIGVRLVEIPVAVRSVGGAMSIDNLQRSNFEVFEDGVAQEITLFKHEDTPLRIGLVFRVGNMPERKERIESAAASFIRESNPNNKTFTLDFDSAAYYRRTQFNQGISEMVESFVDAPVGPGRIAETQANLKKAVLVIAGVDGNDSALTGNGISSLLNYLKESNDITVYAVGLQVENGKPASKAVRDSFTQIAEKTGGEAYFPASVDQLRDIFQRIAHDLRNRYTLGYSPKNTKTDGTWREIRVSVISPPSEPRPVVRAKQGYTAPAE